MTSSCLEGVLQRVSHSGTSKSSLQLLTWERLQGFKLVNHNHSSQIQPVLIQSGFGCVILLLNTSHNMSYGHAARGTEILMETCNSAQLCLLSLRTVVLSTPFPASRPAQGSLPPPAEAFSPSTFTFWVSIPRLPQLKNIVLVIFSKDFVKTLSFLTILKKN